MNTSFYISTTLLICVIYLFVLLSDKKFRLLLPSSMHTITWMIVAYLLYSSTMGWMSHGKKTLEDYSHVAPFIFGMVVSSILGFSLAHSCCNQHKVHLKTISIDYINILLKRYRWVLYGCFFSGILTLLFLISIGAYNNLGDYRIIALTTQRTGIWGVSSWLGGHLSLLGTFYIALFGYKQSICGIDIKYFFVNILMYGMTNIAIAGRGWITMAMIPYLIGYFYGKFSFNKNAWRDIFDKNFRKLCSILVILALFFSIFGMIRNDGENSDNRFYDKFLYYTDGSYVTNLVMEMFPDGTFPLEYGRCEFLSKWFGSPMQDKFSNAISNDVGLSVTVPSTMPSLYYDFGFSGGIIMWGVFCFIFEISAIKLSKRNSILSFFCIVQLTRMVFQAPIGPIFNMAIASFEWLLIMYIFKHKLFGTPNNNH